MQAELLAKTRMPPPTRWRCSVYLCPGNDGSFAANPHCQPPLPTPTAHLATHPQAISSLIYAGERVSTDLAEVNAVAKLLVGKYRWVLCRGVQVRGAHARLADPCRPAPGAPTSAAACTRSRGSPMRLCPI